MASVTKDDVVLSGVERNRLLDFFENNPKEVENALAILHQEQQQQQQPIYGVDPSILQKIVDAIVDIMVTKNRAKLSLKEEGRSKLAKNGNSLDLLFGCLGQH